MWIETIEGGLVNSERAIGIQTTTQGTRHEVDIEVSNHSTKPEVHCARSLEAMTKPNSTPLWTT